MPFFLFGRRQYLIKKRFQWLLILSYAVVCGLLSAVAGLWLHASLGRAVESHLYSSHLRVERSGEIIAGILLQVQAAGALLTLSAVLLLSLLIFRSLNRYFQGLETDLRILARGEFTLPAPTGTPFPEISRLQEQVEELGLAYAGRFLLAGQALCDIDRACAAGDPDRLRSAREKLAKALAEIRTAD